MIPDGAGRRPPRGGRRRRDPGTLLALAGFGMAAAKADVVRRQLHETFSLSGHERWVGTRRRRRGARPRAASRNGGPLPDTPPVTVASRSSLTGSVFPGDVDLTSSGPSYGDLSSKPRRPLHVDRSTPRRGGPLVRDLAPGGGARRPAGLPRCPGPLRPRWPTAGTRRCCSRCGSHGRWPTSSPTGWCTGRTVGLPFVEAVERRTTLLHLERLARHGSVVPADGGYVAA